MKLRSVFFKLFAVISLSSLTAMLTATEVGYDQKFLNKRVAAYVSEITAGGHVTQECIKGDMQFLSANSLSNEVFLSYTDLTNFDKKFDLYSKNEKAKEFLSCCREIYKNNDNLLKIQVYIFMDRVCSLLSMFSGVAEETFFTNVFD